MENELAELMIKSFQDCASEIRRWLAVELAKIECEDIVRELQSAAPTSHRIRDYKSALKYLESQ